MARPQRCRYFVAWGEFLSGARSLYIPGETFGKFRLEKGKEHEELVPPHKGANTTLCNETVARRVLGISCLLRLLSWYSYLHAIRARPPDLGGSYAIEP